MERLLLVVGLRRSLKPGSGRPVSAVVETAAAEDTRPSYSLEADDGRTPAKRPGARLPPPGSAVAVLLLGLLAVLDDVAVSE